MAILLWWFMTNENNFEVHENKSEHVFNCMVRNLNNAFHSKVNGTNQNSHFHATVKEVRSRTYPNRVPKLGTQHNKHLWQAEVHRRTAAGICRPKIRVQTLQRYAPLVHGTVIGSIFFAQCIPSIPGVLGR